jgi:hypothetical protein
VGTDLGRVDGRAVRQPADEHRDREDEPSQGGSG